MHRDDNRSLAITPPESADSPRKPRQRRRARDRVAGLLKRLRQRTRREGGLVRKRMRKRKAALALSAGVMGLSTAAMQSPSPLSGAQTQSVQVDSRLPSVLLHASDDLKQALIEEEGVRYRVYRDVAGHPTVGVGHLVTKKDRLRVGDRIGHDKVLDLLERDLRTAEEGVRRLVGNLPLFQHEFDALVDLVFNVGEGNVSPDQSPQLNQAIAAGDYFAMAEELGYHHAAGEIARGLVHRSDRRANIFTLADYDSTRPAARSDQTV